MTEVTENLKHLYEKDYNLWILKTVNKLESREFSKLDLDNLIEEVADLSKRSKRKLQSLLIKLIEHLLKLTYWENENQKSKGHWRAEIRNFRQQINLELDDSPSLKPYLLEIYNDCYHKGRAIAADRSQLPLETFPETPMADLENILDENWFPFDSTQKKSN
ncbi:MAG: DUF29 domain-containing protein [Cyanobacteria bacterium SW_9_44_58]|nr:MAG: DUF29 domain-containing protein [Cyanobacteria bacterium SW_9_44_58]